jgi:DNA-binding MarR family transcriptional regulator
VHGSDYGHDDEAQTATGSPGRELAGELAAAVTRLRRALRRSTRRHLPFEPLPRNQIDLLRLAGERPGLSVAAAAAALSLAPNTVSTLVNGLCRAGLLARVADDADRRVAHLSPTAAGLDRMVAWRDRRAEILAAALGELAGRDREALAAALPALERLIDALERREGAGP